MTVPPSADPVALIPNANDLLLLNQCDRMVGIGPKIIPHDNPVRKPWQRSNCQNFVHSAVAAVATTRITLESGSSADSRGTRYKVTLNHRPGDKQRPFKIAEVTEATREKPREEN